MLGARLRVVALGLFKVLLRNDMMRQKILGACQCRRGLHGSGVGFGEVAPCLREIAGGDMSQRITARDMVAQLRIERTNTPGNRGGHTHPYGLRQIPSCAGRTATTRSRRARTVSTLR